MKTFDLIVLGGGPGGYTAAVQIAKQGKTVALIDQNALGGTCLNTGCIPTKTLLASAKLLHNIQSKAALLGLSVPQATMDYAKVLARKDRVVGRLVKGLEALFAEHKITIVKGQGIWNGDKTISVKGEQFGFKKLIIATGSKPRDIPAIPFGGRILSSTEALSLAALPKSMLIVGGGVIGVELATFFAIAGVKVSIVEMQNSILPGVDPEAVALVQKSLERKGVEFKVGLTVSACSNTAAGMNVILSNGEELQAEYVLNAVGRQVDISALQNSPLKLTEKGYVEVNDRLETSVKDVYAIGDVTGITWLAHGASYQGEIAAANVCGQELRAKYHAVPACIFTLPEIAYVGKLSGNVSKAPLALLGKMQAEGETDGFIKIYSEPKTGLVCGGLIVGPYASELLAEGTLSVALGLKLKDLEQIIRPHPTLSEIYSEAYLKTHQ